MIRRSFAEGAIDRRGLAKLAGGFLLATAAFPASADDDESARLDRFFESVFQRDLARSPVRQSRLGIRTNQDKWDDISDAHRIEDADLVRADLKTLRTFNVDRLNAQAKLSYRMFEYAANDALKAFAWRWNDYLVTQMGGMHSRVPITLQNSHPIKTRADADAYVARLHGVKPLMEQLVEALQAQEAKGVVPARFIFPLTLDASRNVVTGRPFDDGPKDSPLWADFKAKVEKADFTPADRELLIAQANAGLREGFGPGYQALIAHLEAAHARATDDAGVWKLPDGGAYYRAMLEHYTTLSMTAEELHALGLKEIERLHGEMRAIMTRTGFRGSLQDFFKYVRTDPKFYYPDTPEGRTQYIADAKALLAEVRARAGEVLDIQPHADVEVRPVEAWREKSAPKAFYQSPPEDDSQPGIFYVNLYDMGAAPKYELAVTLYHEAVPGHHVETVVGQEIPGLPRFRKFASIAAYSEGWGLYAERLTKEMGLYQDPYSDFGRLALSVMRAARLVVDTGMHAQKWTRDQAIAYLDENMPSTHYDNQREIDRYIVLPGQATAYEVGMLKILALREKAKAALGDRFDLRAFHDVVVGAGPVPLPILEENVDAWLKAGGGFPPGRGETVMKRLLIAAAAMILGALCGAPATFADSTTAALETTYVQAGRLLADPATGKVETDKTLVIRSGRVVEIRDGFVGEGRVIDLRDSFVLPGLIDSHVHLCAENGPDDKMNRVTKTAADLAIDGAYFARITLNAGFTTVADLGEENDAIFALRDGVARGRVPGPRIIAAGNVISPHGGEGDVYGYRLDVIRAIERPNLCSGADDCRRVVRQQVQRGADIIKIVATGAVLSDAAQGLDQQFTDDELKAMVETAHMLGRRITAHAHGAAGINAFLRAGGDSIEHGTFMDDESIRLLKARHLYYVPTLMAGYTVERWAKDPHTFLSPAARDKALLVGPQMIATARKAHAAGVLIAFGTDSSVSPHGQNAHEFELLVQAGLTPLEAIQTATVAGADHLQLSKDIGSLAPGKAADLIAVKGDPLKDVSELERVSFVMKSGTVYR